MLAHRWRLDGQLALVTGGSAGIGRAIARELLGFGARVLIAARDSDGLDSARVELEEEFPDGEVRTCVADVADDEQRRELLDWVEDIGDGLNGPGAAELLDGVDQHGDGGFAGRQLRGVHRLRRSG